MSKAVLGARIVLGLIFTVFGLNGFFNFIPLPEMSEGANNFLGALAASGYMFPVIKITEIVCGVLLLIGRWVPLALTVLAPVVLNIVLFHVFLEPSPDGLFVPILSVALGVFLARSYGSSFAGVLKGGAQPD
ncbi:MAG: DoxX family membrane protein [bacterium]|nr:DoxX family membrane protein [bacterium]